MKKFIASLMFLFCIFPAFAQPTIELSIVKNRDASDGTCWFTYQFTNNTPITLESLAVKSRLMDKNNQLISTTSIYINNIRPSKTLSDEGIAQNTTCSEISRIVVEDVTTCRSGEKNYSDCGDILKLLPGKIPLTTK